MPHDNLYKDFTPASLFKESQKPQHLKQLFSAARGYLDIYEAACLCNRCGACAQHCPSYKALKSELYSPRGRNQLIRLLLERKLTLKQDGADAERTMLSCIMCGQCSMICPVNAPTAALAAEARTALDSSAGSALGAIFTRFYKLYFNIKNLKYKLPKDGAQPKALYLANAHSLKYAKKSLNIINSTLGQAGIIKSGLFLTKTAFTRPARETAAILNNIKAEYMAFGALPVVVDNIEDYRLLTLAQCFTGEPFIPAKDIIFLPSLIKKGQKIKTEEFKNKKILLQYNCAFYAGDDTVKEVADIFNCAKGDFLVEFNPQGPHSTGLLAYTDKIKGAAAIKKDMAEAIARQQADYFIVLSAADTKLFKGILKQYYPYTKVLHITEAAELFYDR